MTKDIKGMGKLKFVFIILQVGVLLIGKVSYAQQIAKVVSKPPIDFKAIEDWPNINSPAITDDGKYAGYLKHKNSSGNQTLYLKEISGKWHKEVFNVKSYLFSSNKETVFIHCQNDSLFTLKCGSDRIRFKKKVETYKLFNCLGKEWLLCTSAGGKLTLLDLNQRREVNCEHISSYIQNKNFNKLLLISDKNGIRSLSLVDLTDLVKVELCNNLLFDNIVIDETGQQVAFIANSNIYYCLLKKGKPHIIATNKTEGIEDGLMISDIQNFSHDGKRLFIQMKESPPANLPQNAVLVDIWSTRDKKIQSQQILEAEGKNLFGWKSIPKFLAVLNLKDKKILQLQGKECLVRFLSNLNDDWVTTKLVDRNEAESNWNHSETLQNGIINCLTGEKRMLSFSPESISPDGNVIVGNNEDLQDIMSYHINSGKVTNLTKTLPVPSKGIDDYVVNTKRHFVFAGWVENTNSILLYDDFDIWKIDTNENIFSNITYGFGRKNNIKLSFAMEVKDRTYKSSEVRILSAFNRSNKQNGFYKLSDRGPVELFMGKYFFNSLTDSRLPTLHSLKAKTSDVWIIERQTFNSSTNYFSTTNFETFGKVSDLHPEEDYNWYTTKLVDFKSINGQTLKGILYLPENLDSIKKNAVIIHYYEKMSDGLNVFLTPDYSANNINIPYFVSNGYVVFTPDVSYEVGRTGESAYNSIQGAANYLSNLAFIDSTKIALQGHSFGGYETNYIVTRTTRFAAGMSASGASDLISKSGSISITNGHPSGLPSLETGQMRLGATLWARPDLYIENSPIFKANRIQTPLLIMANKLDGAVEFTQGLEFYNALRRLRKTAWMLQYDGEGHSVNKKRNRIDYTIRMKQFFDHYLKDKPAPRWMTDGIPAKNKGYDPGY